MAVRKQNIAYEVGSKADLLQVVVAGNIIQTSVVDTRVDNRRLADKVENLVGFIRTVGLKKYLVMRVYITQVSDLEFKPFEHTL